MFTAQELKSLSLNLTVGIYQVLLEEARTLQKVVAIPYHDVTAVELLLSHLASIPAGDVDMVTICAVREEEWIL